MITTARTIPVPQDQRSQTLGLFLALTLPIVAQGAAIPSQNVPKRTAPYPLTTNIVGAAKPPVPALPPSVVTAASKPMEKLKGNPLYQLGSTKFYFSAYDLAEQARRSALQNDPKTPLYTDLALREITKLRNSLISQPLVALCGIVMALSWGLIKNAALKVVAGVGSVAGLTLFSSLSLVYGINPLIPGAITVAITSLLFRDAFPQVRFKKLIPFAAKHGREDRNAPHLTR